MPQIKLSLFLNFLLFAVLMTSDGPMILQVQKHYGVSESEAGILGACRDLSIAVAAILIAAYVVRIGYKRCMLIALFLAGVSSALVPVIDSFGVIKMMFIVTGVCFGLMKVSIFASLGLIATNEKSHASTMNYLEATYAVGTFAGYFIFSAYADGSRWLWVYYVLTCATLAAAIFLWVSPLDESGVKAERTQPLLIDCWLMLRLAMTAVAGAFVASVIAYDVLEQSIMKWLPTFNSTVLHLPVTLSIQFASILAATAVVGRIVAGIALKFASWLTVLLICLGTAAALILIALPLANQTSTMEIKAWTDVPMAAFIFPLVGLVIAPIYPVMNSAILSSLPPRQHGAMSGLIMLCSALGGIIGAVVTGKLFQEFGGKTAFYWILVPLSTMAVSLTIMNYFRNKEAGKTVPVISP